MQVVSGGGWQTGAERGEELDNNCSWLGTDVINNKKHRNFARIARF